jgi:hypothetical protein
MQTSSYCFTLSGPHGSWPNTITSSPQETLACRANCVSFLVLPTSPCLLDRDYFVPVRCWCSSNWGIRRRPQGSLLNRTIDFTGFSYSDHLSSEDEALQEVVLYSLIDGCSFSITEKGLVCNGLYEVKLSNAIAALQGRDRLVRLIFTAWCSEKPTRVWIRAMWTMTSR